MAKAPAQPQAIVAPLPNGEGALVVLAEPWACRCGHMAAFVVNRAGRTRCVHCDAKFQETGEG